MGLALHIDVSDDIASRLTQVVRDSGESIDAFVHGAVVTQIEDYEDGMAALRVKNDPDMEYVSTDELIKNLDL